MKGRVLIIDAEPAMRRNLVAGLTQNHFEACACPDGVSALLELSAAHQKGTTYNYLVIDLLLPDIHGLQIYRIIKSRIPDLTIILTAAHRDKRAMQEISADATARFIEKPFEVRHLVETLEGFSGRTTTGGLLANYIPDAADSAAISYKSIGSYFMIRITDAGRSKTVFDAISSMEGIKTCDAVLGNFDIVAFAQVSSEKALHVLSARIRSLAGVEVQLESLVLQPALNANIVKFIAMYRESIRNSSGHNEHLPEALNRYIIVDVDKNHHLQISTAMLFTDGLISCDIVDGGTRLVGLVAGRGGIGKPAPVVKRIRQFNGVLRVREVSIIRLQRNN